MIRGYLFLNKYHLSSDPYIFIWMPNKKFIFILHRTKFMRFDRYNSSKVQLYPESGVSGISTYVTLDGFGYF
jgi:hypothetical protein